MTDSCGRQMTYAEVEADMERAHAFAMIAFNLVGWMIGNYR